MIRRDAGFKLVGNFMALQNSFQKTRRLLLWVPNEITKLRVLCSYLSKQSTTILSRIFWTKGAGAVVLFSTDS